MVSAGAVLNGCWVTHHLWRRRQASGWQLEAIWSRRPSGLVNGDTELNYQQTWPCGHPIPGYVVIKREMPITIKRAGVWRVGKEGKRRVKDKRWSKGVTPLRLSLSFSSFTSLWSLCCPLAVSQIRLRPAPPQGHSIFEFLWLHLILICWLLIWFLQEGLLLTSKAKWKFHSDQ